MKRICSYVVLLATCCLSHAECAVKGGDSGGGLEVGEVGAFGDLKVRMISFEEGRDDYFVKVDMKAPGFEEREVHLNQLEARKFSICGQEVTLTYTGVHGNNMQYARILVSVF